jgi:hypothetical protein
VIECILMLDKSLSAGLVPLMIFLYGLLAHRRPNRNESLFKVFETDLPNMICALELHKLVRGDLPNRYHSSFLAKRIQVGRGVSVSKLNDPIEIRVA